MTTREELVQAVKDASDAWYAADDARDVAEVAYDAASVALADYDDKEKNTSQLDRLEKLLVNVRTEEFDNWCKESDDGADEEKNT